ncbi:peptidoglycan-binding protein [Frankia sp. AiPs1]|uniref:peptidoglycan-binding domain-containing protein n=1 Tax=Frankia sp. AiPs1 TaxID=573493 RepID=UPI00204308B6|nr:peptidoglycan-binding domain-containing protein [Frankia sp. AiPs1]MCM3920671.1 peptidoglycan-binding protein [Frankia sp. AiPs1]
MTKRLPGRHRAPAGPTGNSVSRKLARAGVVAVTVAACSSVATIPALAAGPVTTIVPGSPAGGPPVTVPNRPSTPPVTVPNKPGGGVPGPTTHQSLPTLRYGSRGSAVVTLQRALRIPADGAFGPATLNAVRRWQASHRLTADGIVGPQTWASLGYR